MYVVHLIACRFEIAVVRDDVIGDRNLAGEWEL